MRAAVVADDGKASAKGKVTQRRKRSVLVATRGQAVDQDERRARLGGRRYQGVEPDPVCGFDFVRVLRNGHGFAAANRP
jgi:hypothetical protein